MLKFCNFGLRHRNKVFNIISRRHIQILSGSWSKNEETVVRTPATEFLPLYKFPVIRIFSIINSLKLYQSISTIFGIPVAFALAQTNLIESGTAAATGLLGISGCIILYTCGYFTTEFIGFVYINDKENIIKISYSDFWGRRKDTNVPLEDIVPFSELPIKFTDGLYLRFKRYSTNDTLKINLKYGKIMDKDGFKKVFLQN